MAYCEQSDLENAAGGVNGVEALKQLADRDGDGSPDQALIDWAIGKAQAWIDSFAQVRYSTPIASTPDKTPQSIRELCAEEAVYLLKRPDVTQDDRDNHEERRLWLRDLAAHKVSLGKDPDPDDPKSDDEYGDRSDVDGAITRADGEGFV